MRTIAFATALLAVTLAAPAFAGGEKTGLFLNGPGLDGAQIRLPLGLPFNGPALDGQQVKLPTEFHGKAFNGPALDG